MKKTKTLLIALTGFLMASNGFAQQQATPEVSKKVLKDYSPAVVSRVTDIITKVPLTPKKQELLAEHFKLRQKTLNLVVKGNQPLERQIAVKDSIQKVFVGILSKQELNDYYIATSGWQKNLDDLQEKYKLSDADKSKIGLVVKEKSRIITKVRAEEKDPQVRDSLMSNIKKKMDPIINQFLVDHNYIEVTSPFTELIKKRKQLGLTKAQTDSLMAANAIFSKMKKDKTTKQGEPTSFFKKEMAKLLTPEQYNQYLRDKNKDKASKMTEETYTKALKLGLISPTTDSSLVKKQLNSYYINQLVVKERRDLDGAGKKAALVEIRSATPMLITRLRALEKKTGEAQVKQDFKW